MGEIEKGIRERDNDNKIALDREQERERANREFEVKMAFVCIADYITL